MTVKSQTRIRRGWSASCAILLAFASGCTPGSGSPPDLVAVLDDRGVIHYQARGAEPQGTQQITYSSLLAEQPMPIAGPGESREERREREYRQMMEYRRRQSAMIGETLARQSREREQDRMRGWQRDDEMLSQRGPFNPGPGSSPDWATARSMQLQQGQRQVDEALQKLQKTLEPQTRTR